MTVQAVEYAEQAARRHGTTLDAIFSTSRKARTVNARCEVMRLLRRDGVSVTAIGALLGRDHTTVLHGLQRIGPGLWFG